MGDGWVVNEDLLCLISVYIISIPKASMAQDDCFTSSHPTDFSSIKKEEKKRQCKGNMRADLQTGSQVCHGVPALTVYPPDFSTAPSICPSPSSRKHSLWFCWPVKSEISLTTEGKNRTLETTSNSQHSKFHKMWVAVSFKWTLPTKFHLDWRFCTVISL